MGSLNYVGNNIQKICSKMKKKKKKNTIVSLNKCMDRSACDFHDRLEHFQLQCSITSCTFWKSLEELLFHSKVPIK